MFRVVSQKTGGTTATEHRQQQQQLCFDGPNGMPFIFAPVSRKPGNVSGRGWGIDELMTHRQGQPSCQSCSEELAAESSGAFSAASGRLSPTRLHEWAVTASRCASNNAVNPISHPSPAAFYYFFYFSDECGFAVLKCLGTPPYFSLQGASITGTLPLGH